MRTAILFILSLAWACAAMAADPVYRNDFENADAGKLPDEFLVIDGGFLVQAEGGNKFLELPGTPLDSFSALFGPTEKEGVEVSARVYGVAKGRRSPAFGLGLNGMSGYRLQVSPGKYALEFFRNDVSRASVKFDWVSGKWTHLRFRVTKTGDRWKLAGKAWTDGRPEPADWLISLEETDELPAGRAALYGSPYSGTPIRYDDLLVTRVKE